MKRYVLLLLLAGCAQTPKELMSENTPTMHKMKMSASDAVYCMARNVENWEKPIVAATLTTRVRPLAPRGFELIVTAHSLDPNTVMAAHVMPEGQASVATVWLSSRPIAHDRQPMKAAMLNGC